MATVLETLAVKLALEADDFDRGLDKAKRSADGFYSGMQTIGKTALVGIAGAAVAGGVALGAMFASGLDSAREAKAIQDQLNQVIESTGGVAGMTAQSVNDLATSLQSVTNFEDDAIVAGENLLLTFTNIGSDVFPAATETMLDMSAALGQDMKSSAVQLGKALNDPIKGITALSKVGVSFTEQQKEQIKAMVAAGDVAGAQTLILAELGREFGGAARATVDPLIQMQNAWGNLLETLAGLVLPIINSLAQAALPYMLRAIEAVGDALTFFQGALKSSGDWVTALNMTMIHIFGDSDIGQMIYTYIVSPLYDLRSAVMQIFGDWGASEEDPPWVTWAVTAAQTIGPILQQVGALVTSFVSWQDILIALGIAIASVVIPALVSIVAAAAPVIAVALALIAAVALVRNAWANNWGGIQEKTKAVLGFISNATQRTMTAVSGFWADNGDSILAGVRQTWESIQRIVGSVLDGVRAVIASALGIIARQWDEHGAKIFGLVSDLFAKIAGIFTAAYERLFGETDGKLGGIAAFWQKHGDAIMGIVNALWSVVGQLFELNLDLLLSGVELILQLLTGDWQGAQETIVHIAETLWNTVQNIFNTALDAIRTLFGDFDWGAIGRNIVQGIADGITAAVGWIKDAAERAAQSAYDAARGFLGISSPSKLAAEGIGKPFAQGVVEGAEDGLQGMLGRMDNAFGDFFGDLSFSPAAAPVGNTGGMTFTINVYGGGDYETGRKVGRGVLDELRSAGMR